ncbi:EpsG family protein [Ramlibacter monticola]|uniref:EpsG family protein n=1 Tax=Ramlibacter monticola TaxID=1926872 RepID=A0A936Z6P5_9BURK|nr:EpsG family protein [Ramlibacter monticola]MBL0395022.1 EpsG family protein [Ramlibacter monticola]
MTETLPYFLMLCVAAVPALIQQSRSPRVGWVLIFVILVLFVGLRYRVGSDWEGYVQLAQRLDGEPLANALVLGDPLFFVILWASVEAGFGVYGANLVTTAIFLYGVFCYCRRMPSPWLALYSALPFLVIVVGMSANRQAAAVGVTLYLLATWEKSSTPVRLAIIAVAASLHSSAAIFLLLFVLEARVSRAKKVIAGITAFGVLGYYVSESQSFSRYAVTYIGDTEINHAAGATQHILLNAIPALVLLLSGRKLWKLIPQWNFTVAMALASLVLLVIGMEFSVAASRLSFYLYPVSLCVLSTIPEMGNTAEMKTLLRWVVVVYGAVMLAGWLTFANHAYNHKPYSNVLLQQV